jgi:hypothetical protein
VCSEPVLKGGRGAVRDINNSDRLLLRQDHSVLHATLSARQMSETGDHGLVASEVTDLLYICYAVRWEHP